MKTENLRVKKQSCADLQNGKWKDLMTWKERGCPDPAARNPAQAEKPFVERK